MIHLAALQATESEKNQNYLIWCWYLRCMCIRGRLSSVCELFESWKRLWPLYERINNAVAINFWACLLCRPFVWSKQLVGMRQTTQLNRLHSPVTFARGFSLGSPTSVMQMVGMIGKFCIESFAHNMHKITYTRSSARKRSVIKSDKTWCAIGEANRSTANKVDWCTCFARNQQQCLIDLTKCQRNVANQINPNGLWCSAANANAKWMHSPHSLQRENFPSVVIRRRCDGFNWWWSIHFYFAATAIQTLNVIVYLR